MAFTATCHAETFEIANRADLKRISLSKDQEMHTMPVSAYTSTVIWTTFEKDENAHPDWSRSPFNDATQAVGSAEPAFSNVNGGTVFFDNVDDFLEYSNNASVNFTNEITVMVWINPGLVGGNRLINRFGNAGTRVWNLDVTVNGLPNFIVSSTGTNVIELDAANGDIVANVFQHLAATFNGNTQTMKIYVNGVDKGVNSPSVPTSMFFTTTPVKIARNFDSPPAGQFYDGLLGDVQILNRALNQAAVSNEFVRTKGRYGL